MTLREANETDPLLGNNHGTLPDDVKDGDDTCVSKGEDRQKIRVHLALMSPLIALIFVALDLTMVTTVSATIAAEFSSLSVVSWLGSAYLIAVAAVQPISGKLTDRFGRRTGFFWALFCFGLGNLMCGLANSQLMLVAGRALAGIGGGAVSSITVFVTSDLVPLRERSVWAGVGNVTWAVGLGIGGMFGGVVNHTVGWRWTFLAIVPCTILVAIGAYFLLPRRNTLATIDGPGSETPEKIDILGSTLLIGALVSFVLGLHFQAEGEESFLSIALMVAAAILFVNFVVTEMWLVKDPIVPLHLLANYSVSGACGAGFFFSITMYSLLYYVPLLIQARGFNTAEVGIQLLGNPIGAAIGPLCTGFMIKLTGGYGLLKPVVFAVFLAGPLGFSVVPFTAPSWSVVASMACLGAGFGSVLTLNLTGLLANIDDKFQAPATSMLYAFRQVGASGGLAVAGIIFRIRVEHFMTRSGLTRSDGHFGLAGIDNILQQCGRNHFIGSEPPPVCHVYFNALHDVFLYTLMMGVAGFVCGMIIRNRSLDRDEDTSGEE